MSAMIDTLQTAEDLKAAGIGETEAGAIARAIGLSFGDDRIATKVDIDFLRKEIEHLESRLTVKMTVIMGGLLALFTAFDRFFG
jgi:hypothetical protein